MKIIGLIVAICLGFIGAIFTYVAFFVNGIPKEGCWFALGLGIGCLSFATIIGMMGYAIDIMEHNLKQYVKNETDI